MTKFEEWWNEQPLEKMSGSKTEAGLYRFASKRAWNAAIEAALDLMDENDPPLLAGELECLREPT